MVRRLYKNATVSKFYPQIASTPSYRLRLDAALALARSSRRLPPTCTRIGQSPAWASTRNRHGKRSREPEATHSREMGGHGHGRNSSNSARWRVEFYTARWNAGNKSSTIRASKKTNENENTICPRYLVSLSRSIDLLFAQADFGSTRVGSCEINNQRGRANCVSQAVRRTRTLTSHSSSPPSGCLFSTA